MGFADATRRVRYGRSRQNDEKSTLEEQVEGPGDLVDDHTTRIQVH